MAGTAIVYKTLHGSTKKYAVWLKTSLKAKLFDLDSAKGTDLKSYKTVIVMSGTYASRMPLTGWLRSNWESIKNKKVVVVAVGAAPENHLWSKLSYIQIPGRIRKNIKYFKIYGKPPKGGDPVKKEYLKRVLKYLKTK